MGRGTNLSQRAKVGSILQCLHKVYPLHVCDRVGVRGSGGSGFINMSTNYAGVYSTWPAGQDREVNDPQ